jgi:hypothetical protein
MHAVKNQCIQYVDFYLFFKMIKIYIYDNGPVPDQPFHSYTVILHCSLYSRGTQICLLHLLIEDIRWVHALAKK